MNITFKGYKCKLNYATYHNGRVAIQLLDANDGSPVATATCNLPEAPMNDDEVAIKDYSENEGMFNVLNAAGVISDPIRFVHSGFVIIPICKLLNDIPGNAADSL